MKSLKRNLLSAGFMFGTAMLLTSNVWAADAAAGKVVYAKCKGCHGPTGAGNPSVAKAMGVELKPLSDASEDTIKETVAKGKGKMKPIAGVAGADLDNLVAAIKAMK
jgi:cytochrome c5